MEMYLLLLGRREKHGKMDMEKLIINYKFNNNVSFIDPHWGHS